MINALMLFIIGAAILIILFFAYTTKNKLASYVSYTILAAVAISMSLNGLAGLIADIDFLSFLESFLRLLSDIVVFIELVVILLLLFISKFKSKVMLLKVTIIVYVVLKLIIEFNIF